MRTLASIQTIEQLHPIDGADKIERASILGWECVVKKGEFQAGDRCVYFEIDSILPDGPSWSEFLRDRRFRVKTIKLRGQISQGIALPLSILPEGDYSLEQDVSDLLGVIKWEPPVNGSGGPNQGRSAGNFPSHIISKTDETRLQSVKGVLEELRGNPFYIAQKYDGTSCTILNDQEEGFMVCSRNNIRAEDPDNVSDLWKMAYKYNLKEKLPVGFAIQGEVCGPKWQQNRLRLPDLDLFVFQVYNIREMEYLDYQDFITFCQEHGLQHVKIDKVVDGEELKNFDFSLENFLNLAKGYYEGTKVHREGIVVRPLTEMRSSRLKGRLSFKVINNDFLLKEEE